MAMATCIWSSPILRFTPNRARCSAAPEMTYTQLQPRRRSANYQPNSWDYDSLQSLKGGGYDHPVHPFSFDKLKGNVRDLMFKEEEPYARLTLIDALQRHGIAYHFEEEINDILNSISVERAKINLKDDVASAALLFRLRRENGFLVSPDLLSSLMDGNGSFKASLQKDIKGLLSLHDASYLAFEGEKILDEARIFATKSLNHLKPSMEPYLRGLVGRALDLPLHWRAPRLEARWFIDQYARDESMKPLVLQLAKLDFNNVQSIHQEELTKMTRWWKDIALGEKQSFARDRLIECFYYATGVVYEPHLREAREALTKIFALIVYLDDVYDVYGTLEELTLFTDAIGKWDIRAKETLPEYMHAIYTTIMNTSDEMADHVLKEKGCDARPLFRKAWHDLCKAFLMEARWYYGTGKPSLQEYTNNGWMSSSGPLMLLHAFPLLIKEEVTTKIMQQLESYPALVQASAKIFRLCNDSATHSAELERGDAPSSLAIYMRENNVKEEDARKAIKDLTMETWKEINEDVFNRRPFVRSFTNACMNLARISHCIYQNGDGLGAPDEEKKKHIKALFFEPVPTEEEQKYKIVQDMELLA